MFSLTDAQREFRDELRQFLADERIRRMSRELARLGPREDADMRPVHRWLGERGWLAVSWPERYGGLGKSAIEAAIVHQELVRHGLPDLVYVVSICYVGDFLLLAGSDALKDRYLPRLARGEISACTLYSEPGVGSDLSSLAARAHRLDGTHRLYGTKIYSQTTQFANYAMVAARTAEPKGAKHEGITLFWVDLAAPGVTVRPVFNISDDAFSDVVFDGVEVPDDHVVGPLHRGWPLLNAALSIERTGMEAHLKMRSWLDAIVARAREIDDLGDPVLGDRMVALDAQVEAGGVMAWRMVEKQSRREFDEIGSAMSKWYNTELARPIARLALDIEGPTGSLSRWDGRAPSGGRAEAAYREAPGLTLSAGTSEIMLYAIAAGYLRVHADEPVADRTDPADRELRARWKERFDLHVPSRVRGVEHELGEGAGGEAEAPRAAAEWQALSDSDAVRLTLPHAAGGLDRGLRESIVVSEEMGRVLLRSLFLETATVAELLAAAGPEGAHWPRVGAIAAGMHRIGTAVGTGALRAWPPDGPDLVAIANGRCLHGRAELVPFAAHADSLVVEAHTASGAVLVLVAREDPRIALQRRDDLGRGDLASVTFAGVPVAANDVLCRCDSSEYSEFLARARLRRAAYLLGIARRAFDMTLAYTRQRRQFGQRISTFQHVSLRLAALAARIEAAGRLLDHVAAEHDRGTSIARQAASTLALTVELSRDVTADAIQLHGAFGILEDADVQRYYRNAAVDGLLSGTPRRLRAAALSMWRQEK
ncbi:MAG: acyl-CoA dehydrogenase family protein [Actinomycetota bacterium]